MVGSAKTHLSISFRPDQQLAAALGREPDAVLCRPLHDQKAVPWRTSVEESPFCGTAVRGFHHLISENLCSLIPRYTFYFSLTEHWAYCSEAMLRPASGPGLMHFPFFPWSIQESAHRGR